MKKLLLFTTLLFINHAFSQFNYERDWATYCGSNGTQIAGNAIDSQGNLYIAGTIFGNQTYNTTFITPDAHQTEYGGGITDGFIAKYNPDGELQWATFYGGSGDDAVGGITIGADDTIYIAGGTKSANNIATPGTFQPTQPAGNGSAGFIAKFSASGVLVWGTYYFDDTAIRQIKYQNNALIITGTGPVSTRTTDFVTSGAFQTEFTNDFPYISFIAKFDTSGSRDWCTYYKGAHYSIILDLCTNSSGIYVSGITHDQTGFYATPGCHQPQINLNIDLFLSKFDFQGNRLWSTYYGGEGVEPAIEVATSGMLACTENAVFLASGTTSTTNIATLNTFPDSGPVNDKVPFLVKFDNSGTREWGKYLTRLEVNSPYNYNSQLSLYADNIGNCYISGFTHKNAGLATTGSYQETIAGTQNPENNLLNIESDSFLNKYSSAGELLWGTYYGGTLSESFTSSNTFNNSFYIIGQTKSTDGISSPGSTQPLYNPNPVIANPMYSGNSYIAKFSETPLNTNNAAFENFTLYPNPSNGNFNLQGDFTVISKLQLAVYDIQGRLVYSEILNSSNNSTVSISLGNKLSVGVYLVKLSNGKQTKNFKIVVN